MIASIVYTALLIVDAVYRCNETWWTRPLSESLMCAKLLRREMGGWQAHANGHLHEARDTEG